MAKNSKKERKLPFRKGTPGQWRPLFDLRKKVKKEILASCEALIDEINEAVRELMQSNTLQFSEYEALQTKLQFDSKQIPLLVVMIPSRFLSGSKDFQKAYMYHYYWGLINQRDIEIKRIQKHPRIGQLQNTVLDHWQMIKAGSGIGATVMSLGFGAVGVLSAPPTFPLKEVGLLAIGLYLIWSSIEKKKPNW